MQPHELRRFLVHWHAQVREELLTNGSGHLTQKQPSLAKKIPAAFPNRTVLLRYVNPCTSWTEDTVPDVSHWTPGRIDIADLALLCERFFTWGTASGIMKKFHDHIYAGACVQRLSSVSNRVLFWHLALD
jgi:hypothetical protein